MSNIYPKLLYLLIIIIIYLDNMDDSEYRELVNYLTTKTIPSRLLSTTKFARANFKTFGSSFQLGGDNLLYKVSVLYHNHHHYQLI